MDFARPWMLDKVNRKTNSKNGTLYTTKRSNEELVLPPPRSLFIAAQFVKPLELRTSSFRFRDKSQFEPWCEDNRVHRIAPLLCFVTLEVIGVGAKKQYGGLCAYANLA